MVPVHVIEAKHTLPDNKKVHGDTVDFQASVFRIWKFSLASSRLEFRVVDLGKGAATPESLARSTTSNQSFLS